MYLGQRRAKEVEHRIQMFELQMARSVEGDHGVTEFTAVGA